MSILPLLHQKIDTPYNDDLIRGAAYLSGDVQQVALSAIGAANAFRSPIEQIKTPESTGLLRAFSVICGISNILSGVELMSSSEKVQYVWGEIKGGLKIARGSLEIISGMIDSIFTSIKLFASSVDLSNLEILKSISGKLASIGLLIASVSTLHEARQAGDLKRNLTQDNIRSLACGSKFLEKVMDDLEIDTNQYACYTEEEFNDIRNKLASIELENAFIGSLFVVATALSVAADILTVGIASQVIAILKPIISTIFVALDARQIASGIKNDENNNQTEYMRYVMTAVSLTIAILTFVASGASGGIVPAVILAIGIIMPVISGLIANYRKESQQVDLQGDEDTLNLICDDSIDGYPGSGEGLDFWDVRDRFDNKKRNPDVDPLKLYFKN
ncbi:MAG: hypothetical protein EBU93_00600 [Chlamydiae bacterium]|nr:hypothetical protein [Chlamydiota bacterium]